MREIKFRFTFLTENTKKFVTSRDMSLDEILDSNFALERIEEEINSELGIYVLEDYPEYEVIKR